MRSAVVRALCGPSAPGERRRVCRGVRSGAGGGRCWRSGTRADSTGRRRYSGALSDSERDQRRYSGTRAECGGSRWSSPGSRTDSGRHRTYSSARSDSVARGTYSRALLDSGGGRQLPSRARADFGGGHRTYSATQSDSRSGRRMCSGARPFDRGCGAGAPKASHPVEVVCALMDASEVTGVLERDVMGHPRTEVLALESEAAEHNMRAAVISLRQDLHPQMPSAHTVPGSTELFRDPVPERR